MELSRESCSCSDLDEPPGLLPLPTGESMPRLLHVSIPPAPCPYSIDSSPPALPPEHGRLPTSPRRLHAPTYSRSMSLCTTSVASGQDLLKPTSYLKEVKANGSSNSFSRIRWNLPHLGSGSGHNFRNRTASILGVGVQVRVVADRVELQQLQKAVKAWDEEMADLVGKVGTVIEACPPDCVVVDIDSKDWLLHRSTLRPFRLSTNGVVLQKQISRLRCFSAARAAIASAVLVAALATERGQITLTDHVRLRVRKVVMSRVFNQVMIAITIFNVLTLCMDHHESPRELEEFLLWTNFMCNICFIAEMLAKWVGLGVREYFSDRFNTFDCILVAISLPEVVSGGGSALTAFRAFRIMRVMRLVRRWKSLRAILSTILKSLSSASFLCLIMLLFIFIYSILGLQLFSGKFPPSERNNYASLWQAALTVFVVITGEQWVAIMKLAMEATSPAASLYFLSLVWLGNYIFVNLFIAILIDNFSQQTALQDAGGNEDAESEELSESSEGSAQAAQAEALAALTSLSEARYDDRSDCGGHIGVSALALASAVTALEWRAMLGKGGRYMCLASHHDYAIGHGQKARPCDNGDTLDRPNWLNRGKISFTNSAYSSDEELLTSIAIPNAATSPSKGVALRFDTPIDNNGGGQDAMQDMPGLRFLAFSSSQVTSNEDLIVLRGTTFGIFGPTSPFRQSLAKVVKHPWFGHAIVAIIALNTITMAIEAPWVDHHPRLREWLDVMDYIFVTLFVLEATAKVVVFGFWSTPEPSSTYSCGRNEDVDCDAPYLRSVWNRVDFFVCITSVLGIFLHFFRIFRSLRSLRLIIRNENVRVVVAALFQALPAIGNVVMVVGFIYLVFGILGVQLFKGTFYYCTDPSVTLKANCSGPFEEQIGEDIWGEPVYRAAERKWVNTRYHFDHIGMAVLTLFEVALGDGWADIMWRGVDAHSIHEAPKTNANPVHALYFVSFVAVGSFFAVNLFVGLLIDRFNELKRQLDGSAFLTTDQADWLRYNKTIGRVALSPRPLCPRHPIRRKIFKLARARSFETVIIACIMVNTVFLCSKHHNQSETEDKVQHVANLTFNCIFTVEALLKLIALERVYFRDGWNRFDFILVISSWIGFAVGQASFQMFRILRIARILRLIKRARGLQKLFTTLYYALPSLLNISLLLMVTYFNFGVVGVQLFARLEHREAVNKWLNFEHLGNAVILLYTISTTELWAAVMEEASESPPGCADSCGTQWAFFYFPAFMVVGGLITINLVITVVLENFAEQEQLAETQDIYELLANFREQWLMIDPRAKGTIAAHHFIRLIRQLPQPIGLEYPDSHWELMYVLRTLCIPINDRCEIRYIDAIHALLRKVFNIRDEDLCVLQKHVSTGSEMVARDAVFSLHHLYAARVIQKAWRKRIWRRSSKCTSSVDTERFLRIGQTRSPDVR